MRCDIDRQGNGAVISKMKKHFTEQLAQAAGVAAFQHHTHTVSLADLVYLRLEWAEHGQREVGILGGGDAKKLAPQLGGGGNATISL